MKTTCEQTFLQVTVRFILNLLPTVGGPRDLEYGGRRCIKIKRLVEVHSWQTFQTLRVKFFKKH